MDLDDRSKFLEQAFDYLRVPDDCREDAEFWILDVARSFRERHEQQRAPRLADLKKQTGAIEKHAAKLGRLLDESNPYFARAAVGYLGVDDWRDDQGDPHLFEIIDPHERNQLTAKLQRLARLASRLGEALPRDTGGPHDLRDIFEGPSKGSLAVDCWELFDWFRPGEATGHVDGHYHLFVEIVYELAIEEKPSSGLTIFTKRAAPRCNAHAKRTPAYRNLRRVTPPGHSPVGLLSASGFVADFYGVPARLRDEIMGHKRRR